jgi:hypothetical protein
MISGIEPEPPSRACWVCGAPATRGERGAFVQHVRFYCDRHATDGARRKYLTRPAPELSEWLECVRCHGLIPLDLSCAVIAKARVGVLAERHGVCDCREDKEPLPNVSFQCDCGRDSDGISMVRDGDRLTALCEVCRKAIQKRARR